MPLRLISTNLRRHWLRSLLTVGSIGFAIFLVAILRAAVSSLGATIDAASADRLVVQSAVSLFVELPLSYQSKLETVDGVETVCKLTWFGGLLDGDEESFFAQFAIDPDRFQSTYPELEIVGGSIDEFREVRNACVLGTSLAETYDLGIGDRVRLKGTIFPREDGGVWEFVVAALYESTTSNWDDRTMFFSHEYLEDSIETGAAAGPYGASVYTLRIAPDADPVGVMSEVDALYENGPQRVQTTTEAEFNRQFVQMLGNVPTLLSSIGLTVVLAIFLAVLNTMLMAGRERTRDVGIVKALGFGDGTVFGLLLLEALLLCALGGLAGLAGAYALDAPFKAATAAMLPGFGIDSAVLAQGGGLALAIGLLAGILPAWRARRLTPVEALRAEEA